MDNIKLNEIKMMVEQGFSARKIAFQINLKFEDVRDIIITNNFQLLKEIFQENKIAQIMELYQNGVSAKVLGHKFSIDKRRILKWAEQRGILRDLEHSHRIHPVNEHIFDKIETQEQAYWLGFLYADAYNNERKKSLTLALKEGDKEHLYKFIEFVSGDPRHITFKETELGNAWSYKINSTFLSNKLKELGCPQAKSFIITYPKWLPSKFNFHFIRGLFDGDGCLTFRAKQREYKWSIVGTKELCDEIVKIFATYNLSLNYHCISKTSNNTYELESSGNLKIEKILDLIYQNASVYLSRKYSKYLELKTFNLTRQNRQYDAIISINNILLNTTNIKKMTIEEKNNLIEPITDYFFQQGLIFPDDHEKIIREYKLLCDSEVNLNCLELDNHSRIGTYICKYFCPSFLKSSSFNLPSVLEAFNNRNNLMLAVKNKLIDTKSKSCNFSTQTMVDELKDLRLAAPISIFKPLIAKYMCLKYSNENDIVGDYSCGFGGRLLGAMSCNRKYIGTDPLTASELDNMINFFSFKDAKIISLGSEYYCGDENSVDLYWSSPPYYDLEKYSVSLHQAYNKGENYFYNIYWRKTLENIKFMLKPNKWFGVNVNDNHYKMIEIAQEYFGDIKEKITLISNRYHFAGNKIKQEGIYMFVNEK